jgi:hypothetical protein
MMTPPRLAATISMVVTLILPAAASAQVDIVRTNGTVAASNALPVDVLLLTYSTSTKDFRTVRLPAHGRAPVDASTSILDIEPLSLDVGTPLRFATCTTADRPGSGRDINAILADLKSIELLETAPAKERLQAVAARARLELRRSFDETQTYREDALRAELGEQEAQFDRYSRVQALIGDVALVTNDRHLNVDAAMSDVTAMATAWASVEHAKLQILFDETKTLEPVVQQVRLAYRIKREELSAYDRHFEAWRAYTRTAVEALDTRAEGDGASPVAAVTVRKLCDGASADFDRIEIEGPESSTSSVLVAEASFDHGGKEVVALRRVGQTSRWSGRVDWPSAGTRATLRVRWPGTTTWYRVPSALDAQRPSQTSKLKDARHAVDVVEDKFKDANFRAAGADTIKTAPSF